MLRSRSVFLPCLFFIFFSASIAHGQSYPLLARAPLHQPGAHGQTPPPKVLSPAEEVDPLIGTDKSSHRTVWESNGGTFPATLAPLGMVQITPDGYHYSDTLTKGFSFLNHASGWSSRGSFLVMPYTGNLEGAGARNGLSGTPSSVFSHRREHAHPWQYDLDLDSYGIHSSFTATAHAGFARFVFPASGSSLSHILLSDLSSVTIISDTMLVGQAHGYYFTIRSGKPFISWAVDTIGKEQLRQGREPQQVRLDYSTVKGEAVDIRIAFSLTSPAAAENNLLLEMPDGDFGKLKDLNKKTWDLLLGRIEIKGGSAANRKVFYTALYHCFFMPRILSDAGAAPRRYLSLYPWDTYRSKHPLITLLDPVMEGEMISSVLDRYDQTGWLPTDNMLGNHNVELILDSYNKGVKNFDVAKAARAIRKSLLEPPYARRDMGAYNRFGYVPSSLTNSVSQTLEFAYNDWAAASFLKETSPAAPGASDSDSLLQRSSNYRHVFDPATGFMRAKTDSGDWTDGGYCEGTEWTYSWYVPHDVQGLVNLMEGSRHFSERLSECFEKGYYVHDNEPPLHYAYLFDFTGEPWKTQRWARFITETAYSGDPGGIPGNDDLGALSSWYVFSAMGFYPVTPGRPLYEIGSPLFRECTIHLANGKDFRIVAPASSPRNKYIRAATLNGRPYEYPWISHDSILEGSTLVFDMTGTPDKKWGASPDKAPPSMTTGLPHFTMNAPSLSASRTRAGSPVEWSSQVTNTGSARGALGLDILVDGHYYTSLHVLLEAGETRLISQSLAIYRSGSHKITMGSRAGAHVSVSPLPLFVEASPPAFMYSGLSGPLPPLIEKEERFPVSVKVKNTGSSAASVKAPLYLNGRTLRSQTVFLQPGEEKEIRFLVSGKECTPVSWLGIGDLPPFSIHLLDRAHSLPIDTALLAHLGAAMVLDFDQGPTGLIRDITGHGNNGKVHGAPRWVQGIFGKAIRTDATRGCYIEIPAGSGLDTLRHSPGLTLMAWVYPMDEENFADILSKGEWNSLQIKGGNTVINFYTGGWEGHEAFCPTPPDWNRHWHHIAGVTRGSREELYVDGRLMTVKQAEPRNPHGETGLHDYSTRPWNIGRNDQSPDRHFKGSIDDIMVFPKALTREEITQLMMHLPGPPLPTAAER